MRAYVRTKVAMALSLVVVQDLADTPPPARPPGPSAPPVGDGRGKGSPPIRHRDPSERQRHGRRDQRWTCRGAPDRRFGM